MDNDYEGALARFAQFRRQEEEDPALNPACYSTLLTHGHKVARSVILMHGMSNCPKQYDALAPLFFERGYNVLIPRIPHSGHANVDTDVLKHLTVDELCECSVTMVEIARGLGEQVTFLGISLGGIMAAWIAQNRADVSRAVIIAPVFTLFSFLNATMSRLSMYLCRLLPNVMTQSVRSTKGKPSYNYRGFATRALGQVLQLSFSVYDAAKTTPPAVRSVLIITNAADTVVNRHMPSELLKRWQAHGLSCAQSYEFEARHHLIHDIIDPSQAHQQTTLVYPILLDLIDHDCDVPQTIDSINDHT